jgi:hypothetical protein
VNGVSPVKLYPSVVVVVSVILASSGFGSSPPAPNAAEIIKKSVAVNTADWKAQPQYSYRENDTKSKIDANGEMKVEHSRSYEVSMIEGSPYNRLIAINNEPLSPAQQQQEQIKLKREASRRQKESASDREARLSKYKGERSEEHMLMQQMVAAFQFRLKGEEQLAGTACYVFDAIPNPNYRPPIQRARVLTGMKGRMWIDKAHYHWVKVEAEVTSPVEFGLFIARVKPGTKFRLEQAPVGDVWLPKRFTQTVNASVLGIYGMHSSEEERYSDYHLTQLKAER